MITWAPDVVSRLKREGLRIDHIYCSRDLLPYLRGMNTYDTSYGFASLRDHCPILAEFGIPYYVKARVSISVYTDEVKQ